MILFLTPQKIHCMCFSFWIKHPWWKPYIIFILSARSLLAESKFLDQTTVYLSLSMATLATAPARSFHRAPRSLEGAPWLVKTSCPEDDLVPLSTLLACFTLRPRGCWLPFPPCTWARFRFLFHEILERENLPSLLWQAGDHYHFRAEGGKITWREHWVQALPLRNKVSEAQRSERTWLLRLGDLRQSGDFSSNGGPTFSIKIQTLDEWVLYGHLCNYLLTDDYLRMDVSMMLCWITCYPIFIVPSRNKTLSFLSTVLSPSPFFSAKQDPLSPPVPYAEHGWGLQVFSIVLGLGMSPGPVWDLEIVKLQRDYHGAGPCSPSLDPGSIWPQAPWTMLPSQEGIHQCC